LERTPLHCDPASPLPSSFSLTSLVVPNSKQLPPWKKPEDFYHFNSYPSIQILA
jgi:hypothetical protein